MQIVLLKGLDPFNQTFRKFRSKTKWIGSAQPEKFRKNKSTFRGGPLFLVGPIQLKWTVPFDHSDPFSIPVPC